MSALRMPRGRRGTAAMIVAVVGLAVCVAGAVEAIWLARHGTGLGVTARAVARFGRDTRLGDSVVLIVGVVAAAVGCVLVLAALVPPRRRLVECLGGDEAAVGVRPRGLDRALGGVAVGLDGVRTARVTGRRRLMVRATTGLRDPGDLADRIGAVVHARVDALGLRRPPAIRVRLHRKES